LLIAPILSDYAPVVLAIAVAAALILVSCASAAPESGRRFFPLEPRSEWTYRDTSFGETSSMAVTSARGGVFRLDGFPGASALRVRFAGETLQAWDDAQRHWEALLRLGAAAGTAYQVDLPAAFWDGARVTVASRSAITSNPVLRRSHRKTLRFAVRPPAGLSDAGVTGLWLAPGLGLVRWVEDSFVGPKVHVLTSARIGGKTIVKHP
jgi:hypothetical protein